jgi:CRP/FNR family transcriptional regulator
MQEQRQPPGRAPLPGWLSAARERGLLSRLPDQLVAGVIRGAQRATYPAGAVVPGWEERPWAAIVLSGGLRVFLPAYDGGQITLLYMRPGDLIGTFIGTRSSLTRSMQAIEPVELLHLEATRLAALAQTEAQLAWEMLLEISRAVRLTHRSYGIRTFGSIRLRLANAILERALTSGPVVPGTVVPGTQHELAIAAGTVREVVATALQGLKRDGVVAIRRGSVVILDPDALNREADGGFGFGPPA